jgi:transcriptional regulator
MHILNPKFSLDRDDALDFAEQRGFGLLVACGAQQPTGSHLPFVVRRNGAEVIVNLHVAKGNPLAELADGTRRFLLAVTGVDSYVSNDWYESEDQVSTWLYEAVHLTGPVRRLSCADNRSHGEDMLRTFEQRLAPKLPWHLDKMEAGKRANFLNAIVSLEMSARTVEGQRKFNQHKPDIDHIAVVRALSKSVDHSRRHLADRLKSLRSHLNYDTDGGRENDNKTS